MADHCYHIIKFCTYTCIFSLGIITSGCEIEKTRTPEIFDCPTLQIRKESKIYVLLDMYVCNAIVMLWAVCWHNQLHLILISLAHHSSYEIENYRLPSCKAFLLCDIMWWLINFMLAVSPRNLVTVTNCWASWAHTFYSSYTCPRPNVEQDQMPKTKCWEHQPYNKLPCFVRLFNARATTPSQCRVKPISLRFSPSNFNVRRRRMDSESHP